MSIQAQLRFNPRNYVHTIFFAENGNDNNSGLSPEKPKGTFYGANAAAALIALAPGERGCIILTGEGDFNHTDIAGNGTEVLTDRWDVHMQCGTLIIAKGTDPVTSAKLVITNSELYLNRLDVNSGGRVTLEAANATLIGEIVRLRGNVNAADGDATTAGKIHVFASATDSIVELLINKVTARANIFLSESDTANIDLSVNVTRGVTTVDTYSIYDILDSDGTMRLWRVEQPAGAGTVTGLDVRGNAVVCVVANEFMGLNIDFNARGTSRLKSMICTNNGNNVRAAGATLEILATPKDYVSDYFVSDDIGDDGFSGLTPNNPFKTLGKALDIIGNNDATIHLLDDDTYTVTGTAGVRTSAGSITIVSNGAKLVGDTGGVTWKVGNSRVDGMNVDGTLLTFSPTVVSPGEHLHSWVKIENPETLYLTIPSDPDKHFWDIFALRILGTGSLFNFDNINSHMRVVAIDVNLKFDSASTEYVFIGKGSNVNISVNSTNVDTKNTGAGLAKLFSLTNGATSFANIPCTGIGDGGDIGAGSKLWIKATTAGGNPLTYSGAGDVFDTSSSEGLNHDVLDSGTAVLTDIFNFRDLSTGNQKKLTFTDLQTLLNVSSLLKNKAGVEAFGTFALSGGVYKRTVTFPTAFVDNAYAVNVSGEDVRVFTIESKAAGSFVINTQSSVAPAGNTFWEATKSGES